MPDPSHEPLRGRTHTPSAPNVPGPSSQSQAILDVIRSHNRGIRRCFERALQRDPDLKGVPSLQWTIVEDGSVTDVKVSDIDDPGLEECLVLEIGRWRFPPSERGQVTIRYPGR